MDIGRLSQGQRIAAVSAIALFVCMFLPWFEIPGIEDQLPAGTTEGIDVNPAIDSENTNAWEAENPLDAYLLIVIIVALGGALAGAAGRILPVPAGAATALLGGIGFLLILYQLIDVPGDLNRKYGILLGLVATAGVAFGGYLAMLEEETADGLT